MINALENPHTPMHRKILLVGSLATSMVFVGAGLITDWKDLPENSGAFKFLQGALAVCIGVFHAAWVTYDARRLGFSPGPWRYAALFLTPFGSWCYLLRTRGPRGLISILWSLLFYAGTISVAVALYLGAAFVLAWWNGE